MILMPLSRLTKNILPSLIIIFLITASFFVAGKTINAQDQISNNKSLSETSATCTAKGLNFCDGKCIEKTRICLNIPIGNLTTIDIQAKENGDNSFGTYLQAWYDFIIGSIGVIATVMMMWGGFKWLTSRGNSGAVTDAKNIIWSALTGVVLAFLSYSILYFINPATTSIGLPLVISKKVNVDIPKIGSTILPDRRNAVQKLFGTELAESQQLRQIQTDYMNWCNQQNYECEPFTIDNFNATAAPAPGFTNIGYDIPANNNTIRFLQENGIDFAGLTTEQRNFWSNLGDDNYSVGSQSYYYNFARFTFTGSAWHVESQVALDPNWFLSQ